MSFALIDDLTRDPSNLIAVAPDVYVTVSLQKVTSRKRSTPQRPVVKMRANWAKSP